MIMRIAVLALVCLMTTSAYAQIPKNDNKEYEYYGESSVRKAGTGDLVKRFGAWAEEYFKEAHEVVVLVDDSTERFVEVEVTEKPVDMHFGVGRVHKERALKYHLKFDCDRKNYKYWVNKFHYEALEVDNKGREERHSNSLSEIKSAATKSLKEEVHTRMTDMIEAFGKAAEIDIED